MVLAGAGGGLQSLPVNGSIPFRVCKVLTLWIRLAGDRDGVDALTAAGPAHGWTLLFPEAHPYAGGQDHYAAYLANTDGFEVELVARKTCKT